MISKWHVLVNSDVLNLKYVIILGNIPIDAPNQNIGDVSPASTVGLTPVYVSLTVIGPTVTDTRMSFASSKDASRRPLYWRQ